MTGPSTYPPVYYAIRSKNVPDYPGGFIDVDLGSLPAGDYSVHVTVSATVASGLTPPATRNLYCVLDTIPATTLGKTAQTTFPSLSSNGNAFAEMPMLATLSTPNAVSLRLRCELAPTDNSPDVQITATMMARTASQIHQL